MLQHVNVIGFNTIVLREFQRIMRNWDQTLVAPAITVTLYLTIFGTLIGSRIGGVGGYSYMQFMAPGLIMMSVITSSYVNVASSFFGAKLGKYAEELLISPLPNWLIVAGYISGGVVRGLIVGTVVTAVTLFFTRLYVHDFAVLFSAVFLSSAVSSVAGMVNAIVAKDLDQISLIPTVLLAPLAYLGGVFYTIELLPQWAQTLSYANPILHMVNAFRFGFLGFSDIDIGLAYLIMIGAALALFGCCVRLLNQGVGTRE